MSRDTADEMTNLRLWAMTRGYNPEIEYQEPAVLPLQGPQHDANAATPEGE
jgi:hypothetical protein